MLEFYHLLNTLKLVVDRQTDRPTWWHIELLSQLKTVNMFLLTHLLFWWHIKLSTNGILTKFEWSPPHNIRMLIDWLNEIRKESKSRKGMDYIIYNCFVYPLRTNYYLVSWVNGWVNRARLKYISMLHFLYWEYKIELRILEPFKFYPGIISAFLH